MWDWSLEALCKKDVACLLIFWGVEARNFPTVDLHDKFAQDTPNCINACCYIGRTDHIQMHLCPFPVERFRAILIGKEAASIPDIGVTRRNEIVCVLKNLLWPRIRQSCGSSEQCWSNGTFKHLS